jgi:hypothetical protein
VQASIEDVRKGLIAFVNETIKANSTMQIAVFGFQGGEALVEISPDFSTSYEEIRTAITEAKMSCSFDDGDDCSTNLHGAVIAALAAGNFTPGDDSLASDFLVVFSDGADRASRASFDEAVAAVGNSTAAVYGVVVAGERNTRLFSALHPARTYELADMRDLSAKLKEMATVIGALSSNLYVAMYCAPFRAGNYTVRTSFASPAAGYSVEVSSEEFGAAPPYCSRAQVDAFVLNITANSSLIAWALSSLSNDPCYRQRSMPLAGLPPPPGDASAGPAAEPPPEPAVATSPVSLCPCPEPGMACVSHVCVDASTVAARAHAELAVAPNMVYSVFSLWDDGCNPYSVPPEALNRTMAVEERAAGGGGFVRASVNESFYGLAVDPIPSETRVLLLVDLSGSVQASTPRRRSPAIAADSSEAIVSLLIPVKRLCRC